MQYKAPSGSLSLDAEKKDTQTPFMQWYTSASQTMSLRCKWKKRLYMQFANPNLLGARLSFNSG
jgi:hypothetical protein